MPKTDFTVAANLVHETLQALLDSHPFVEENELLNQVEPMTTDDDKFAKFNVALGDRAITVLIVDQGEARFMPGVNA